MELFRRVLRHVQEHLTGRKGLAVGTLELLHFSHQILRSVVIRPAEGTSREWRETETENCSYVTFQLKNSDFIIFLIYVLLNENLKKLKNNNYRICENVFLETKNSLVDKSGNKSKLTIFIAGATFWLESVLLKYFNRSLVQNLVFRTLFVDEYTFS